MSYPRTIKSVFPKPLLQDLSLKEQQIAHKFSEEICEKIAKLAGLEIAFTGLETPGKQLLKILDRRGCTYVDYSNYLSLVNSQTCYYRPQLKVALLISNEKYEHLSPLVTPSTDCVSLGKCLRELGFITVFVNNTKSETLKNILIKTIDLIPENSYCFLIYAGHGCELINTKCILSIDSPAENMEFHHCVTENWLLREIAKCKPELCVLIMDMCRFNLDRQTNPQMYASISNLEEYTIHNNLLISYSTQSSSAAYEFIYIEKEETIGTNSYSLRSTDVLCGGASQYVNALCSRLNENDVDISSMLDKVHEDVEKSIRHQRPIKVQCGVSKRFLSDPVKGDTKGIWLILKDALKQYNEYCTVSMLYSKEEDMLSI